MSDRMLKQALALASRGFRVHPLEGKRPILKGWPQQATTDADRVREWWSEHPEANVGIATGGGFVAIDVDPRNGGDRSIGQLEETFGPLPADVRTTTGGGGWHLWCQSNGRAVPSGKLALGIDVKSNGGQIVAPPSVHPDTGKKYKWATGRGTALDALPLLPEWVADRLAEERVSIPAEVPDVINEGQRDDVLISLAGSMRRRGMSEAGMLAALRAENETRCRPPLSDEQVSKIAKSAAGWAPGDTSHPSHPSPPGGRPPALDEAALQGVAGDVVRAIEPHTEADPAGILVQFLVMAGNAMGRAPGFTVEADRHGCNLFAVLVGDSSKGRKGVSFGQAKRPIMLADESWSECILSGASSGEGLINAVRDPSLNLKQEVVEPGADDKRALIYEPEFASVLRRMRGEGNSLGALLRQAWDGGRLSTLTRHNPLKASDSHVSMIAHITRVELQREFTNTDTANGFGNRLLWVRVQRSKSLPHGGNLGSIDWSPVVDRIREALQRAQGADTLMLPLSPKAALLWEREYERLTEGGQDMFSAVTSRGEAQVRRLAVIYAVLDGAREVKVQHLRAALAVWRYCEESARDLFGDRTGDDVADRILAALQESPDGLTRQAITVDVFGRHMKKDRIDVALSDLQVSGRAYARTQKTGGRPAERWHATANDAKDAKDHGATRKTASP